MAPVTHTPKVTPGGSIFNAKVFLAHYSHIIHGTLLKLISTCSMNSAELCDVAHFCSNFTFMNSS